MLTEGNEMTDKVIRFKREAWAGGNSRNDVPIWHIAAHDYRRSELYRAFEALCGYRINLPYMARRPVLLSIAKKVRGPVCLKCTNAAYRRTRMADKCSFCNLAATIEDRPWILRHGLHVMSFKPFGASTPMHRMFVPMVHVEGAADDPLLTARCFEEAARWAAGKGKPFNLIVNSGAEAGQSVFHLHVHYVPRTEGDRILTWRGTE